MQLYYKKLGSGPAFIILHGLYGSGDNWYTIARHLEKHFTIYLVDLRNHGLSPHNEDFSYQAMTSDLAEFFEAQNIGKAHILGHSMGGKVAVNFAFHYPEMLEKLIIIDIALRSYKNSPQIAQHQQIIDSLISLDIEDTNSRNEIEVSLSRSIHQSAIRQFLLKNLKRDRENKFYWSLNLKVLKEKLENLLQEIELPLALFPKPVMVVRGLNSGYITEEDIAQFQTIFQKLRIENLPTGHWVHAEEPEKTIALINDFLLQP